MFKKLLLLFIVVPVLELALFMALGKRLGPLNTLLIIIVTAILGAALTKSQGAQALFNFQKALASGQMPHREIVDGLLILIAGAVLLTPGFFTDAVGFLFLFPPARAVIRKTLADRLKDRLHVSGNGFSTHAPPDSPETQSSPESTSGTVIDV